jgi:hypothetical protein
MKKYNFFEALAIAAGTERGVRYKDFNWCQFKCEVPQPVNDRHYGGGCAYLVDGGGATWWPTAEQQKEKAWEVEPEEVYFYGVCDDNGESWLHVEEPQKDQGIGKWVVIRTEINIPAKSDLPKNLFPKDKPQKYKLVAVED